MKLERGREGELSHGASPALFSVNQKEGPQQPKRSITTINNLPKGN